MRVLVVGSGGREHALAWRLARSPSVTGVLSAPGNPGMATLGPAFDVGATEVKAICDVAIEQRVDLVVVGPEAPLVAGLVDALDERGIPAFGPTAAAAEIEGSKVFSREFAARRGIPMAEGEAFSEPDPAKGYARSLDPPLVVKAEGLAAGKGVLICADHEGADAAIDRILVDRDFGDAGERVVVEEFLRGRETSIFCLTDGEATLILEPAQDYKRAHDGDEGANTGGMGAYSPVGWLEPEVRERAIREIVEPAVRGLAEEGRRYVGCLYAGLMVGEEGPKLLEFNCRFGDPEAQVLLPRLSSDFGELLLGCVEGTLVSYEVSWSDHAAVGVVVASGGYPGAYRKGLPIDGIDDAEALDGIVVFQAGTASDDGRLVSAGGRVLNVVGTGPSVAEARDRAYEGVGRIRMDGMEYRTDIARDA